jgi:hypothetical protein
MAVITKEGMDRLKRYANHPSKDEIKKRSDFFEAIAERLNNKEKKLQEIEDKLKKIIK